MGKKKTTKPTITPAEIEQAIHVVRGQRVMLDSELAKLYRVSTSRLNEQVTRNKERFPEDFAFQLTQQEFTASMSQIAISKPGRGGRRKRPWAFTEQGVAAAIGTNWKHRPRFHGIGKIAATDRAKDRINPTDPITDMNVHGANRIVGLEEHANCRS